MTAHSASDSLISADFFIIPQQISARSCAFMSVKPEKVSELFDFRRSARAVLDIEKQAIDGLYQYLDEAFERACEMVLRCGGKIVVYLKAYVYFCIE
jgi:hypothetical protein